MWVCISICMPKPAFRFETSVVLEQVNRRKKPIRLLLEQAATLATHVMAMMFGVLLVQGMIWSVSMRLFSTRMVVTVMVMTVFAMHMFVAVMPLAVMDILWSRRAYRTRGRRSTLRCTLCHGCYPFCITNACQVQLSRLTGPTHNRAKLALYWLPPNNPPKRFSACCSSSLSPSEAFSLACCE